MLVLIKLFFLVLGTVGTVRRWIRTLECGFVFNLFVISVKGIAIDVLCLLLLIQVEVNLTSNCMRFAFNQSSGRWFPH